MAWARLESATWRGILLTACAGLFVSALPCGAQVGGAPEQYRLTRAGRAYSGFEAVSMQPPESLDNGAVRISYGGSAYYEFVVPSAEFVGVPWSQFKPRVSIYGSGSSLIGDVFGASAWSAKGWVKLSVRRQGESAEAEIPAECILPPSLRGEASDLHRWLKVRVESNLTGSFAIGRLECAVPAGQKGERTAKYVAAVLAAETCKQLAGEFRAFDIIDINSPAFDQELFMRWAAWTAGLGKDLLNIPLSYGGPQTLLEAYQALTGLYEHLVQLSPLPTAQELSDTTWLRSEYGEASAPKPGDMAAALEALGREFEELARAYAYNQPAREQEATIASWITTRCPVKVQHYRQGPMTLSLLDHLQRPYDSWQVGWNALKAYPRYESLGEAGTLLGQYTVRYLEAWQKWLTPRDLPDLTITGFEVNPPLPVVGEAAEIAVTVQNAGSAAADDVSVSLTAPTGFVLTSQVPRLEPGAEQVCRFQVRASAAGQQTVVASADPRNRIEESEEGNNGRQLLYSVAQGALGDQGRQGGLPDLVVTGAYLSPGVLRAQEPSELRASVRNTGAGPANAVEARTQWQLVPSGGSTAPMQQATQVIQSLGSNEERPVVWSLPGLDAGRLTVKVEVDPAGRVAESNEQNNTRTLAPVRIGSARTPEPLAPMSIPSVPIPRPSAPIPQQPKPGLPQRTEPITAPRSAAGAVQHPYFPLSEGSTWEYRYAGTVTNPLTGGAIPGSGTTNWAVERVEEAPDGRHVLLRWSSAGEGWSGTTSYLLRSSGTGSLAVLLPVFTVGSSLENTAAVDFRQLLSQGVWSQPPYLYLVPDLVPGASWVLYTVTLGPGGQKSDYRKNVIGQDVISVPAGTFTCIKVMGQISVSQSGGGYQSAARVTAYTWYARGVGLVREQYIVTVTGSALNMQTTGTAELVRYTISEGSEAPR